MEPIDVLDLAERQYGHVATYQLRGLGLGSQAIWRMRRSGGWEPRSTIVLARRGAPASFHGWLTAGVLDTGPEGFLSGPAAAALWKLSGFSLLHLRDVDTTRPRGGTRRPSSLARVHEVLDLQPDHVTAVEGIPVSTPARTVFELAATVSPPRAERACDSALARNLTSVERLRRMLDDWADRGRAGTVVMRDILERRPLDYVPPASNLESRFAHLAQRYAVGPFRRQVDLGGQSWIGRVDFLHERCPLVVEVLSQLAREGTTMVMATHDLRLASTIARQVVFLDAGVVVETGTAREVFTNPQRERTKRFIATLTQEAKGGHA